mmetsp:Transcript_8997/g.18871  ORF Transcript_8997/g.18871 Transcript_8997/m.18871 type:complete len:232 (-) Transcript_8997:276-971(-)
MTPSAVAFSRNTATSHQISSDSSDGNSSVDTSESDLSNDRTKTMPTRSRPRYGNNSTPATPASLAATSPSKKRRALSNASRNPGNEARDPRALLLLSFPIKLHLMLDRSESERTKRKRQKRGDENQSTMSCIDSNDIIMGWLPSGKAFKIYDEERFVREVMPTYFLRHDSSETENHFSFETFERNLDLWGFTDMVCIEGPTTRRVHVCSHPMFVRGNPSSCRHMRFRVDFP